MTIGISRPSELAEDVGMHDPGVVRGNVPIAGRVAEMVWPWLLSVYISNVMALLFKCTIICIRAMKLCQFVLRYGVCV